MAKIKCDVDNCIHCDCDKELCKLPSIKVCNSEEHAAKENKDTMCGDFCEKDE